MPDHATSPPREPELEAAVLRALRPRGPLDRLAMGVAGGWSPAQVLRRLPPDLRDGLLARHPNPILARREALDRVVRALYVHVDAGRVERRRTRLKGALVDVYRPVRRGLLPPRRAW